jgi:hypothetical protein
MDVTVLATRRGGDDQEGRTLEEHNLAINRGGEGGRERRWLVGSLHLYVCLPLLLLAFQPSPESTKNQSLDGLSDHDLFYRRVCLIYM